MNGIQTQMDLTLMLRVNKFHLCLMSFQHRSPPFFRQYIEENERLSKAKTEYWILATRCLSMRFSMPVGQDKE